MHMLKVAPVIFLDIKTPVLVLIVLYENIHEFNLQ